MSITIDFLEAKTKLPQLLQSIQAGNRYTITLHGVAVADLVPPQSINYSDNLAAVDEMLSFMEGNRCMANFDLKLLLHVGRT